MILTATQTHATNLARFVVIYKAIRLIFKILLREIKQYHTMIAAFVGGYYVFGKRNSVNEQVISHFT